MAAEVQHTLLNLEVAPPPGAWDTILARLDTEFDIEEIKVSEKIGEFEMVPPALAWKNIEAAIVANPEEVEQAPVISINRPFRKWAAVAATIAALALGGWYFFGSSSTPPNNTMGVVPQIVPEAKTVVPQTNNLPQVVTADVQTDRPLPRRALMANPKKLAVVAANYNTVLPGVDIDLEPSFDYSPQTGMRPIQSANTSPNVKAPPIRDAQGNIILDTELIFAGDNNYIVVTSPNGEQTRMSSKFLPLLSSLNGNPATLDYFHFFLNENNIWKMRFNEWRDKMLRQANLIPTATNLLDIIQLKEFLEDN